MSRKVKLGNDFPRSASLVAWGCLAIAGPSLSCGSSSSSVTLSEAGVDAFGVGYLNGPASIDDCEVVLVTPNSSLGCREDWSCPGVGLYSFSCGGTDGGGLECYCRVDRDIQKSGVVDTCGDGSSGVTAAAQQFCGWNFLSQVSDGGGAQ
jgi:hypothetical protein